MQMLTIKRNTTILIFLLTGIFSQLQARHIIGGEITYECLGNDQYEFTLLIYRDCNCTDCAEFDPFAAIAVYNCDEDSDCGSFGQADYFTRLDVPLLEINNVAEPTYPCLVPPDVCVQEGLYRFTLTLPNSPQSYHVSYQRCCRNVTINNIIGPESSGATYTVAVTPEAQDLCNSSPEFNEFPPIVICADTPLEFDHSATDPDGDQLVYSFCAPLDGGGNILVEPGVYTCDGAIPTPACPPPYNNVNFIVPNYSADQPMGGAPLVTIDPNTGLITGTPNILGQFVVGVCVQEFRNGQLLGEIRRDFQFNVASCDPTVVADIDADEVVGEQQYVVNTCGNSIVTFENESFQERFIEQFEWSFDINGTIVTESEEWNATIEFPGEGTYEGQLILNPGTNCGDTAQIFVNVFPEVIADFSYVYDTCVAGPVDFTDLSSTGACCLTEWDWSFGDGNNTDAQNPSHVYMEPGNIPVTLTVTDTNSCVDSYTQTIEYFPVPSLIIIAPSSFIGCTPAEIFFDNLSFPIDSTYDITWDFGDGGFSTAISPTHIFEIPGNYTVTVDITSPIGCQTDTIFPGLIDILPSPTAGFDFTPNEPSSLQPEVVFTDQSQDAASWFWDFDTGATSILTNPTYVFPDTGMYEVAQIVTHPSGCQDTLIQVIDVIPEVRYNLPNAFTPNNDSTNDIFKGVGILDGATNFRMTIWNRWGELVFETTDPDIGWNGLKNNTGQPSPNGVYPVVVNFIGPRGEKFEYKGVATLIR
ncbi:MAG: PKD domain-containing protein [Saprospiraceae bacterium]|nr:PKD domain-containing protein [Saprospiraceae bacterium]